MPRVQPSVQGVQELGSFAIQVSDCAAQQQDLTYHSDCCILTAAASHMQIEPHDWHDFTSTVDILIWLGYAASCPKTNGDRHIDVKELALSTESTHIRCTCTCPNIECNVHQTAAGRGCMSGRRPSGCGEPVM